MFGFIPECVKSLLSLIMLYYGVSFVHMLLRNIMYPLIYSKRSEIKKFGNWAVITGATDGIGKGFVYALAKDGFNLVLISRTKQKLEDLAKEIVDKFQVQVNVIDCDYTQVNIYERIESELKDIPISLLVNNVGMSYPHADSFDSTLLSPTIDDNLIHCNCLSVVKMTRILLKLRFRQNGGFIINISSASGDLKTPYLTTYSASKSFVDTFSESLSSELSDNPNITILNVAPYVVSTKMSNVEPTPPFIPTANSYAKSVLRRLGTVDFTNGCLGHEIQNWFLLTLLPTFLRKKIIRDATHKMMVKGRAKSLKNN